MTEDSVPAFLKKILSQIHPGYTSLQTSCFPSQHSPGPRIPANVERRAISTADVIDFCVIPNIEGLAGIQDDFSQQ